MPNEILAENIKSSRRPLKKVCHWQCPNCPVILSHNCAGKEVDDDIPTALPPPEIVHGHGHGHKDEKKEIEGYKNRGRRGSLAKFMGLISAPFSEKDSEVKLCRPVLLTSENPGGSNNRNNDNLGRSRSKAMGSSDEEDTSGSGNDNGYGRRRSSVSEQLWQNNLGALP